MKALSPTVPPMAPRKPDPSLRRPPLRPTFEVEQVQGSWSTVERLFHATQARNADGMLKAYADDARIDHALLGVLSKAEYAAAVGAFLRQTPDYALTFQINNAGVDYVEAEWALAYTFQATGRRVRTEGESVFRLGAARIVHQRDDFDRRSWSRQALGLSGFVLSFVPGWRRFVRRELRQSFVIADQAHV